MRQEFAPHGRVYKEGEIITRPRLAKTLQIIANEGADAFYNGTIANHLINTISELGGIMTLQDLLEYTPAFQVPAMGSYRGDTIITAPPPASGAVLISVLNILENIEKEKLDLDEPLPAHQIIEGFKHVYAQRGYLGDPSDTIYRNISEIARYFSRKETAAVNFKKIKEDKTFPVEYYKPSFDIIEDHGTVLIVLIL